MKKLLIIPLLLLLSSMAIPPVVEYLPNLRCPPLEMWKGTHVDLDEDGNRVLRISFAGENQGPGHLIVIGEKTSFEQTVIKGTQVVGNSNGEFNALPHQASYFKFHGLPHQHWHWHGWAIYGLVKLSGDQQQNVIGKKQSFCLMDGQPARKKTSAPGQSDIPWDIYVTNLDKTYKANCFPYLDGTMAQRVSAGYMDIYGPTYNAPLRILSDGIYALVGIVDTKNDIKETNEYDNMGIVVMYIEGMNVHYMGHLEW